MQPATLVFYIAIAALFTYAIAYRAGLRLYVKKANHPTANKIADTIQFLAIAVGIVFFWKGAYSLIDNMFMPGCPVVGNIIAALLGFALIVIVGGLDAISVYIG
jgi:uncharacterized membrane protein